MRQMVSKESVNGAERNGPEVGSRGETVAEVAHDARNMVTVLGLYCDLLEKPGVLASPFAHYGSELRLVAAASQNLVEKLAALEVNLDVNLGEQRRSRMDATRGSIVDPRRLSAVRSGWLKEWETKPSMPIGNLAVELLTNHNLLAALAGPSITLTVDVDSEGRAVWMTSEDLIRVLVNLVKNAAEIVPAGGRIQIRLCELPGSSGAVDAMVLTVEDSGPGIPDELLEKVFEAGFTTRASVAAAASSRAVSHRGLGLAITRAIVESAGGRITASNRIEGGARFEIVLPVRKTHRM